MRLDRLKDNESIGDQYFLICDVARFGKDTTRISLWDEIHGEYGLMLRVV